MCCRDGFRGGLAGWNGRSVARWAQSSFMSQHEELSAHRIVVMVRAHCRSKLSTHWEWLGLVEDP